MSLRVDVGYIDEAAQRPEVLPDVSDRAFDFSFFPSRPHMTGTWNETIVASKGQEAGMKPHEVSIVLRHHGGHVVEPELARHAGHGFEGMDVAAHQSLKRLAVRELEIHLPAVALNEAEGVQLSRVAFINKRPEVTPVDLKTLARRRLHAHEGATGFRFCPHRLQVIFDNRVAARESTIA